MLWYFQSEFNWLTNQHFVLPYNKRVCHKKDDSCRTILVPHFVMDKKNIVEQNNLWHFECQSSLTLHSTFSRMCTQKLKSCNIFFYTVSSWFFSKIYTSKISKCIKNIYITKALWKLSILADYTLNISQTLFSRLISGPPSSANLSSQSIWSNIHDTFK